MTDKYKSESSINKVLAELQLAGTAIANDVEEEKEKTFELLLREALQSENEAIKIYRELSAKSEQIGSKMLVKAFNEIAKDEQQHIGNLQWLLKSLCPEAIEIEKEGEAEEVKLQSSDNQED